MYRFSIIVPCYNVEKYLKECVESIEKQSFKNYEILLINDGSTDSTAKIAEMLCKSYGNIKYFSKPNGGLSHTRNYGINIAEGQYIYFLDSDDMLDDNSLYKLNSFINEHNNPDVVITRYRELDDMTKHIGEKTVFPNSLYNLVSGSCKINKEEFKSENIKDNGFVKKAYRLCYLYNDIKPMASISVVKNIYIKSNKLFFKEHIVHEDELWTPQVFLNADSIGFLDESCYIYRVNRAGSIMNKINKKNICDRLRVIDELEHISEANPEFKDIYISRCACILNGVFGMCTSLDTIDDILKCEIKNKIYIFKKSIQKKYMLMYLATKLIGVKNTIKLISLLKHK